MLYVEEPLFEAVAQPFMREKQAQPNIRVLTPVLPEGTPGAQAVAMQRALLEDVLAAAQRDRLILRYYTPMALATSRRIQEALPAGDRGLNAATE